MRNLKKILALVLALVMTFSVMATANAFTDDSQIDATYDEAVTVLSNLKVFQGYKEDGSFRPQGNITRAEVAAIIYRIVTGDVNDTQVGIYADYNKFSDVKSTSWYAGYVNFCANAEYIKGYGNGKFGPDDKVTGYQALAMILRAVGYDKNGEFTGANWQVQTAAVGKKLSVTDNVSAGTLGGTATREVVAEILFRAIQVPQVEYTVAFGYQNKTAAIFGAENASLGAETFGLKKTEGVVEAVGYQAGTTTLGTTVVTDTDANWENIGYEAYAYTVATSGAKTRTAVSDVTVTGKSLGVNTNGTAYTNLTTAGKTGYIATLDKSYALYYNGVLAAVNTNGTWAIKDNAANTKFNAALGKVGTKVDFIDNDNGGKAEAVVVTEYTVAHVTGIANANNTGYNAVAKDTYYFDYTTPVGAKYLVCSDELAYGDLVTYVKYNTEYYTVKSPLTTDTFTRITRQVVGGANVSYTIGGNEYIIAAMALTAIGADQQAYVIAYANLVNANLNKSFDVYTDPYGYILTAAPTASTSNYLYVMANDHTVGTTGLTNTKVAYTDGTISATVSVASVTDTRDTETYFGVNAIPNHIYKYTEKTDGSYKLTLADSADFTANYVTGTANWGSYGVNLNTKVIDLRTGYVGEVYTGWAEIPSLTAAQICCIVDTNGVITLAYLVAGTNTNDLTADFIVYKTSANYSEKIDNVVYYYLDVLVDGAVVNNYQLAAAQYENIKTYGVGEYYYDETGALAEYTSFDEEDVSVVWYAGSIKVGNKFYTYDGETVKFNVINVTKGTVNDYTMVQGADYTAYLVYNTKGTSVIEIYIIVGEVAVGESNATFAKDGGVWEYVKANNKITKATYVAPANCNVTLNGAAYKNVKAGTEIELPNKTEAMDGTGMIVNGKYYAYGAKYTVTADTTIVTGYVKFTIDGNVKAVKYNDKYTLGDKEATGTHHSANWNGTPVMNKNDHEHTANCDHVIVTGYYKVTVTDTSKTVTLNGTVVTATTFYVTANDKVVATKAGEPDATWGAEGNAITGDITIGATAK